MGFTKIFGACHCEKCPIYSEGCAVTLPNLGFHFLIFLEFCRHQRSLKNKSPRKLPIKIVRRNSLFQTVNSCGNFCFFFSNSQLVNACFDSYIPQFSLFYLLNQGPYMQRSFAVSEETVKSCYSTSLTTSKNPCLNC